MALKWRCTALPASRHKELSKRGETIPCTSFLGGGEGGGLLYSCSLLPYVPQLLGIEYVLGRHYLPMSLSPFCTPSGNSDFAISKSCLQDSSSLTGEQQKQSNVARSWHNRIWQNTDHSMHYWKVGKLLCVKDKATAYHLMCPVIFVSSRTTVSIFTLCLWDIYEQCDINCMYVFPEETHLFNFLRKFPLTSFENKPSHPFPYASNKNKKPPANWS